jgi:hypothetical protein
MIVLFALTWLAAGRLAAPLAPAVLADVVGVVPEEGRVRHVMENAGARSWEAERFWHLPPTI